MHVVLLGTAAGGGFPQWNCWCPTCRAARTAPHRASRRSQSSAAVSVDGKRWFLLNASPDVREQLDCLPGPMPDRYPPRAAGGHRDSPTPSWTTPWASCCSGKLVTCRYTPPTRSDRFWSGTPESCPSPKRSREVEVTEMVVEAPVPLRYRNGEASGISVLPFEVPAGPPRFAGGACRGAHRWPDPARRSQRRLLRLSSPDAAHLDRPLLERLGETDLLLFDGTFWTDDELISLGIGDRRRAKWITYRSQDRDGSLAQLAGLAASNQGLHSHQQHQSDAPGRLPRARTSRGGRDRGRAMTA